MRGEHRLITWAGNSFKIMKGGNPMLGVFTSSNSLGQVYVELPDGKRCLALGDGSWWPAKQKYMYSVYKLPRNRKYVGNMYLPDDLVIAEKSWYDKKPVALSSDEAIIHYFPF
jgi:hypothetical protein